MLRKQSKIYCLFLLILFINSLIYYSEIKGEEHSVNKKDDLESASPTSTNAENIPNLPGIVDSINTSGSFKLRAFFTQDNFVDIDENGYVYEWEDYNDVRYNGEDSIYAKFRQYTGSSDPDIFWPPVDTYQQLRSESLINGEHINSTVFSPVFNFNTKIQGKIFFLVHGDVWPSFTANWILKITLDLFNSTDKTTIYVTSTENHFDDTPNQGTTFEANIAKAVTIPAGFRLRLTYEVMRDSGTPEGNVEIRTGEVNLGLNLPWIVNDINNTYDKTYALHNFRSTLGIQLLMYEESFPTIDLTGFTNNTIYSDSTNATITVSDSILNNYKWDSDSFAEFTSPYIVSLPETQGWHTLTIKAEDYYVNIIEDSFIVGYDSSPTTVILESPANNSLVTDGQTLNFSVYGVTENPYYEWDKIAPQYTLLGPAYDIYLSTDFNDLHNLTIYATTDFGLEKFVYFFEFDNSVPVISLKNVVNDTDQPPFKNIDVEITDRSDLEILYKWDENSNSTWAPIEGDTYRTYLPASGEYHFLYIYAEDSFNLSSKAVYRFNTSAFTLLVDLKTMVNGSYYFGNDIVEVTIVNYNLPCKYKWGNNPLSIGTVIDNTLNLSGGDALSQNPGTYWLTIIVYDLQHLQCEFVFKFIVDREKPTIIQAPTDPDYNDLRFLQATTLSFTIADNWTIADQIEIYLSLDNAANVTYSAIINYYLGSVEEGLHNLTIIAIDIAGNSYKYFITFTIDISSPGVSVTIDNLATLLDGSRYVPADTTVTVVLTDDDLIINSYYSWNSSDYLSFTDNFTLPSTEGFAALIIKANDSLGNYRTRTYWLIIDNTSPYITLKFINNESKINLETALRFNIEDLSNNTVDLITTEWNLDAGPSIKDETDFTVYLIGLYLTHTEANLTIYSRDVVGNERTHVYLFYLDFTAPVYELVGLTNNSYVRGNSTIDFNVISNDLSSFYYSWDNNPDLTSLNDPWDLLVPLDDGVHKLYIFLEDDTGGGLFTNSIEANYVFIVDDLSIDYITPNDFTDNYNHTMFYGENFTITVNITDRWANDEIENVSFAVIKEDALLNLSVDVRNITNTEYLITIFGTNVTNDQLTSIEVRFWQTIGNNHSVSVNLRVDKLNGYIVILSTSKTIIFGENFTLTLQLFDNLNDSSQEILYISVDGNDQDIFYTCIDEANQIYQITFNTRFFVEEEGEHSFTVHIEANFYSSTINSDVLQVIVPSGLSLQWIIIIIALAVLFSLVMGFVIYRVVRARPFEELMCKVSEEDIKANMETMSPGVILSIFDQKKGPIPLVGDHALDSPLYNHRMRIGVENFLLKISDQAYSSLGFEEHDERRRTGSINLPNEDMVAFIHGIQLANPAMRGGFENLSLIVLADKEVGGFLLANQEFLFLEIDELKAALQDKKALPEIETLLTKIRERSLIIMIAVQKNAKKDKNSKEEYQ
ncbi:MAG: hypothetical protein HZR80_10775 [Candidatus Heimdallarchaeota archaeon]